jgi:hypothetical protein
LDNAYLDNLEALADRATPAPWQSKQQLGDLWPTKIRTPRGVIGEIWSVSKTPLHADMHFVCAAREAVPDLIAEVRRLRAQRDDEKPPLNPRTEKAIDSIIE